MVWIQTFLFITLRKILSFFAKATKLFEQLQKDEFKAITSIVSLIEALSFPMSDEQLENLKNLFLETPNLTIYETTQSIGVEAAKLRRKYHFRLGDAMQLATAICAKADVFITNDERLTKCKEMKVKLLK